MERWSVLAVINAIDLELRAGARLLLQAAAFQVAPGDKIGLVGRNGAGKTTLARLLAGEAAPAAGTAPSRGPAPYLPPAPTGAAPPRLAFAPPPPARPPHP